ncbi:Elongator complex protein 4 [Rhexocercosporidium sp. MPI-PUGE-AT-0058]|nr:Elongator complex protein 4 [Rhexocercosporidium sp. MPI-PUGE-AT-0058]
MAFRKRSVVPQSGGSLSNQQFETKQSLPQGVRPSPLEGRLTTSTGTHSLDSLLSGHSGLALGTSLFIEENGTTDFAGVLVRYYAAEGVVQGHHVHVLGMSEAWGRELPGLSVEDGSSRRTETRQNDEKMKIAWRYERLGEFGAGSRDRSASQLKGASASTSTAIFCHDFDLSKRLILPSPSNMKFVPLSTKPNLDFKDTDSTVSPFTAFLSHVTSQISATSNTTVHRIVIPNILSPAIYPIEAAKPEHLLQFLHALRALLRKYPTQLTAVFTLPLTLYPRITGLTRWVEILSDGVLELAPFPSAAVATKSNPTSTIQEEPPQGMLKIHRLPIFHEKGGGGGEASGFGDDLAFTLSRRKGLVIKPFSLPPVEGDSEAQQGGLEHDHGKATKADIEF